MVASARGRGSSGTGEDWIWLTLVLCGVGWQCWNAEHLQVHCRQEEARSTYSWGLAWQGRALPQVPRVAQSHLGGASEASGG